MQYLLGFRCHIFILNVIEMCFFFLNVTCIILKPIIVDQMLSGLQQACVVLTVHEETAESHSKSMHSHVFSAWHYFLRT